VFISPEARPESACATAVSAVMLTPTKAAGRPKRHQHTAGEDVDDKCVGRRRAREERRSNSQQEHTSRQHAPCAQMVERARYQQNANRQAQHGDGNDRQPGGEGVIV
jgi:hypothetical protein